MVRTQSWQSYSLNTVINRFKTFLLFLWTLEPIRDVVIVGGFISKDVKLIGLYMDG